MNQPPAVCQPHPRDRTAAACPRDGSGGGRGAGRRPPGGRPGLPHACPGPHPNSIPDPHPNRILNHRPLFCFRPPDFIRMGGGRNQTGRQVPLGFLFVPNRTPFPTRSQPRPDHSHLFPAPGDNPTPIDRHGSFPQFYRQNLGSFHLRGGVTGPTLSSSSLPPGGPR